jgi:hypothetical protein
MDMVGNEVVGAGLIMWLQFTIPGKTAADGMFGGRDLYPVPYWGRHDNRRWADGNSSNGCRLEGGMTSGDACQIFNHACTIRNLP